MSLEMAFTLSSCKLKSSSKPNPSSSMQPPQVRTQRLLFFTCSNQYPLSSSLIIKCCCGLEAWWTWLELICGIGIDVVVFLVWCWIWWLVPCWKFRVMGPLWIARDMAVVEGHPVNCCTNALKLEVLALRRVMGVLLETLDLLRIGLNAEAFGVKWWPLVVLLCDEFVGLIIMLFVDDNDMHVVVSMNPSMNDGSRSCMA